MVELRLIMHLKKDILSMLYYYAKKIRLIQIFHAISTGFYPLHNAMRGTDKETLADNTCACR